MIPRLDHHQAARGSRWVLLAVRGTYTDGMRAPLLLVQLSILISLNLPPLATFQVYELRDNSWYDRGTGHCRGVYDDAQDLAMLIVEAEIPEKAGEEEGEGGYLKEELLLSARVEKDDIYSRQQGGSTRPRRTAPY